MSFVFEYVVGEDIKIENIWVLYIFFYFFNVENVGVMCKGKMGGSKWNEF